MAAGAKFIAGAISRPGALTAAVGGPPSQNLGKVRQLAKSGTPQEQQEARFYLNVLAKTAGAKRAKKKSRPPDEVDAAKAFVAKRKAAAAGEPDADEMPMTPPSGKTMPMKPGKNMPMVK